MTTVAVPTEPAARDDARALPGIVWRVVVPIAVAKVVFQLATSALYGAHRDEFYYLAGGHHLAWGYVDHPPLVPWIYRLSETLFGHSIPALHVFPALIGGVFVVLGALLARELGGGRRAQVLAATVAALGPLYGTTSHFLSTVTLDIVFWALASLFVVRIVRTGDTRWWLAVGAVCGAGLLNKHTMAFWMLGAVVGLLATSQRRVLASRWLAVGAAIAFAMFLPNLVWQATHHWATLEFLRNLRRNNGGSDVAQFLPLQLGIVSLAGTVVWFVALRRAWSDGRRVTWRWLAMGYVVLFVVLFVAEGKAYYLGSWYLPLVAAGAVVIEQRWSERAWKVMTGAVVVTSLVTLPLFTPLLPIRTVTALGIDDANKDMGGMLGWHDVVDQVAAQFHALARGEQAHATILTDDYSEAGAVDFWHDSAHVPEAISGHNSYWLWGYARAGDGPVLAVGVDRALLSRYWGSVVQVGALRSTDAHPIDPQERDVPMYVCRDQRAPWSVIWPHLRHYE